MSSRPDVSIVIVSYNTRELLADCLGSIAQDGGQLALETFVVDNASADGSADMVAERFPWVRLIRNEGNSGFAAANNQAIRESRGRYVLLLNPDTLVRPGGISRTVDFMDRHPQAGIATCKVLNPDLSFQTCYAPFPGLWNTVTGGGSLRVAFASLLRSRRFLATQGLEAGEIDHEHPVDGWVMGAFMMIRRQVVEQVGLLDEQLFMYGEEPDYCYRAHQAGWAMWYVPSGSIIHLGGQSTRREDAARRVNWQLTTRFYLFGKHRGPAYARLAWGAQLCSAAAKIPVYGLLQHAATDEAKRAHFAAKREQMQLEWQWCLSQGPRALARRRPQAG